MPLYEYECEKCGNIEEAFQKFSDKPLKTCGHCSGKLHKLISQSSFHLKGTGWYVTDYAGKKAGNAGSPEAKQASPEPTEKKAAAAASSDTAKSP
jgi:putative FmdB family regulatory protein